MQRILERGQIESIPHADIERVRKPRADRVFAERAHRLRTLSVNHAIGDYLRLMAALADSQQRVLATRVDLNVAAPPALLRPVHSDSCPSDSCPAPSRKPALHVTNCLREVRWPEVLQEIVRDLLALPNLQSVVRQTCEQLSDATPARLEAQAQALLGLSNEPVDAARAPFVMAALQVCWTYLASRSEGGTDRDPKALGGCPVCDSAPVASIVHIEGGGHRYLVCPLCASEWHFVRALCTHCGSSKGISQQSIDGGSKAVRAECCENCHTYRKIFYREHDAEVEPLADDLASLALDLLLSEAGYRRGSGHPLLWQT